VEREGIGRSRKNALTAAEVRPKTSYQWRLRSEICLDGKLESCMYRNTLFTTGQVRVARQLFPSYCIALHRTTPLRYRTRSQIYRSCDFNNWYLPLTLISLWDHCPCIPAAASWTRIAMTDLKMRGRSYHAAGAAQNYDIFCGVSEVSPASLLSP
jgi:hypothetical protein